VVMEKIEALLRSTEESGTARTERTGTERTEVTD